jgi:hypothetical protein
MSAIRECRELGDSWPKAIRETIAFKPRLGWAVIRLGRVICKAGEKIVPGGVKVVLLHDALGTPAEIFLECVSAAAQGSPPDPAEAPSRDTVSAPQDLERLTTIRAPGDFLLTGCSR